MDIKSFFSTPSPVKAEILSACIRIGAAVAVSIFAVKYLVKYLDPTHEQRKGTKLQAKKLLAELGVDSSIQLNDHEMQIASNLVTSQQLSIEWEDIGGCDQLINELLDRVILPLKLGSKSPLLSPPKDSFLRFRQAQDHEATAMMKAQFMSAWDGFASDNCCRVIIIGATNRPLDVDKAILRRMPARFQINSPDVHQRESILRVILRSETISRDVNLSELAKEVEGCSGSDMREICRLAAVGRAKELIQLGIVVDSKEADDIPLTQEELVNAARSFKFSHTSLRQHVSDPIGLD